MTVASVFRIPKSTPKTNINLSKFLFFKHSLRPYVILIVSSATVSEGGVGGFSLNKQREGTTQAVPITAYQNSD